MIPILKNVKNRERGASRLVIASALIALSISGVSSTARAEDEGSGLSARIEGTWILNIYRVNQGFSFSALQSFTAGGVTLATGTIDRTPPPISPLYGSWRRTGHNGYVATICFFAFDAAGNAVAMIKTNETFQIADSKNLTGSGTALACDINGDNCVDAKLPITITGKRLIAQGASD
jgi:hypothetical protein